MKKLFFLLTFLLFANFSYSQYSSPESVAYDSTGKRYIIANTNTNSLLARSQNGTVTTFVSGASSPHGLAIYNGNVYVACNGTVRGYKLSDASLILNVNLGATFLNGMDVDANGILYISDFSAKKIYKLNVNTQAFWVYVANTVSTPNGVCVDAPRNRVLFCNWGSNAPVKAINLADSSVSTLVTTTYSNCDGIKMDRNNNVYVSTWGSSGVFKYDVNFSAPPTLVITGLSSPADIFINKRSDTLVSPNTGNSTVSFHFLNNPTSIGNSNIEVKDFSLNQNYPNPFNPVTSISFNLNKQGFVNLSVYNINGKKVSELINANMNAGFQSVSFNAENLASGIYTYKLSVEGQSVSKNMVLIK
ncbi:MAG: T9SS type A sorting domain-containing protein [Bacteroidetes bacterium]|nr:T9SS type A sorting domain-containing protein [Bacteroidota bacterium]